MTPSPYRKQPEPRLVRGIALERLDRFTQSDMFSEVNLYSQLYRRQTSSQEYIKLDTYPVPDRKRIPFEEAIKGIFRTARIGDSFGPSWSTHWFHVEIRVPSDWKDEEEVQFWFDTNSEGLIWSEDGVPLQGLTGGNGGDRHVEFIIPAKYVRNGEPYRFYIEVACNGMFGLGAGNFLYPPDPNRYFTLDTAQLVAINKLAWALYYDFQIIRGVANNLPSDSAAAVQALKIANDVINTFVTGDDASLERGRDIAKRFLGTKGANHRHQITALGHCHIDTAWLWPFDETKRKVARSWSTQVDLMDRYPEHKFVCSQIQQFVWLEEYYPKLFLRVKEKVDAGQFLPIGGTWVEMDANMPSGEAFCRQFLFGQRFLKSRFGKRSRVFWLPDTFGYSAQLPQIVLQAGAEYFFTQKLSWNNINKFPNTTFNWIGLDGSSVLTHMAPSETYAAQVSVDELTKSVNNNKDKAYSDASLLLYGNGDGGGGPLPAMLERLRRVKDVDGLPPVEIGTAEDFYDHLRDTSRDLCSWKGELYFELHRGTYTSHGSIKRGNRYSELLLRNVEALSSLAFLRKPGHFTYPRERINKLWRNVLLNQFHDVLPGSGIEMIYQDAEKLYSEVNEKGNKLLQEALEALYPKPDSDASHGIMAINTLGWERTELVTVPISDNMDDHFQIAADGNSAYAIATQVPPFGHQAFAPSTGDLEQKVTIQYVGDLFILENSFIIVKVDQHGRVVSLVDKRDKYREVIAKGAKGNQFIIYEDQPLYWDAWDVEIYHLAKGREVDSGRAQILDFGPLRASLLVNYQLSPTSTCRQTISLSATSPRLDFENEVEWHENRQFLKVEFPVDIYNDYATYETQFGFVQRPTHFNTTWDAAKFEVCGHKFADLSEYGYGVALINDCKYGYATHRNVIRLSLLRSPKAPDNHCDMGHHRFRFALFPHLGSFNESNVVREGYQFNVPLITRHYKKEQLEMLGNRRYFEINDAPNVVLDTIKQAEDSTDIVLRLYEAYGGHARAKLHSCLPIKSVRRTNILEDDTTEEVQRHTEAGTYLLPFRPFEFITLKITFRLTAQRQPVESWIVI